MNNNKWGISYLEIAKVRNVKTPTRGTVGSAGIDFYVPEDYPEDLCSIEPGERFLIPSGIKVDVPDGFMMVALEKSGVALKKSLIIGAKVIDSDYQGEIHLHLINAGTKKANIKRGEKLVQFVLVPASHCPIIERNPEELYSSISERGTGGFGSTGTK